MVSVGGQALALAAAFVFAGLVGSLIIVAYHESPLHVYSIVWQFSTSRPSDFARVLVNATPLVFSGLGGNPVEMGLIASFARPGGNITGVVNLEVDLGPKRLEMFRDLVPGLHRILFPYDPTDASSMAAVRGYREAARRLGLVLVEQPVRTLAEA